MISPESVSSQDGTCPSKDKPTCTNSHCIQTDSQSQLSASLDGEAKSLFQEGII